MASRPIVTSVLGLVLAHSAFAPERTLLTEHFVAGKIRVFYAIEGKAAVPLADANSNSVPDHVEDVAKQVWAASPHG